MMKSEQKRAKTMAEVLLLLAASYVAEPEEAEEAKELGERCFRAYLHYLKATAASATGEAEAQAAECKQVALEAYTWLGNFMAL